MNKLLPSKKNSVILFLHIVAWLVLIIIPHIVITYYSGQPKFIPWHFFINIILYGVVFYANYIWLVSNLFLKNKKAAYFFSAITAIIIAILLSSISATFTKPPAMPDKPDSERFDFNHPNHDDYRPMPKDDDFGFEDKERKKPEHFKDFNRKDDDFPFKTVEWYSFVLISIIVTGFAVGLKVIEKYAETEKRQRDLEKEKLNSELAFLKNQISPHFFFNTLNNIYSLIEINTQTAQESVHKLSKLMRYLLYETESKEVFLSAEIDFMKNYIDLMRLRISKRVNVEIHFPESNINKKIPPLLFIPFIENAFKHGVSFKENSFIKIVLLDKGSKITFLCVNSVKSGNSHIVSENHSGIGLANVKKRLELLFPDRHKLKIQDLEESYSVSVEIDLNTEQ